MTKFMVNFINISKRSYQKDQKYCFIFIMEKREGSYIKLEVLANLTNPQHLCQMNTFQGYYCIELFLYSTNKQN